MSGRDERKRRWTDAAMTEADVAAGGFRLLHYFTVTSLIAFAAVALVLYVLQRNEVEFFEQVQREQNVFFDKVQAELARNQDEAARKRLLAEHEASHVNLARLFANVLWESDFSPFVARVAALPVEPCRAIAASGGGADAARACFARLGKAIQALPGFRDLDAKAYRAMRASSVFKIKVFDLRGITAYSSEHGQIGEDKADNLGWRTALAGTPASELTHRDRFSAFEGVVENRDLISTYLPVRAPGGDAIVGVFEIYSDVTGFLAEITEASAQVGRLAEANQAQVERIGAENEQKVSASSDRFLLIVGSLLALLYGALLLLVRNGQRIIDEQVRDRARATRREERWHQEKMAALAAMAANVSHEVGNPLATISGLAQEISNQQARNECPVCQPRKIVEETRRIAAMMRQITDFASARRGERELVDVNQMVKAVLDFLRFDRRFGSKQIEFRPDGDLPAHPVVPDALNEILMNLLQSCSECRALQDDTPGRIHVETGRRGDDVVIRIGCECGVGGAPCGGEDLFSDSRFDSVRRRVAAIGGQFLQSAASVEVTLPPAGPAPAAD